MPQCLLIRDLAPLLGIRFLYLCSPMLLFFQFFSCISSDILSSTKLIDCADNSYTSLRVFFPLFLYFCIAKLTVLTCSFIRFFLLSTLFFIALFSTLFALSYSVLSLSVYSLYFLISLIALFLIVLSFLFSLPLTSFGLLLLYVLLPFILFSF